jgi:hypothetical protein
MCIVLKIVKKCQRQFCLENKIFKIFSIGDADPLTISSSHAAANNIQAISVKDDGS